MDKKLDLKKMLLLVSPLLAFAILLIPYSWANQAFIVDWLGCGCPTMDEFGNMITSDFNANDFTAVFWGLISLCVTVAAVLLSRKIPKEKWWLRILYVVGMLVVSLLISYQFVQMMMWN